MIDLLLSTLAIVFAIMLFIIGLCRMMTPSMDARTQGMYRWGAGAVMLASPAYYLMQEKSVIFVILYVPLVIGLIVVFLSCVLAITDRYKRTKEK